MVTLDLDAVRAFVLVAELSSFTRAADALGTTQSAVSLKLKRLETHLGHQLLERTPRVVRLSADGAAFLGAARELIGAHERALGTLAGGQRRLALGLSEHVADADLARQLATLRAHDPRLVIELHLGLSAALLVQYDERRLDAAIIRREPDEPGRDDARVLFTEPLVWLAAPGWQWETGTPLPLALLAGPCAVRSAAIRALDAAGVEWSETFVGGGVAAVGAAVEAGLAVSPLARRVAPRGLVDVGARCGLPALPQSQVTLHSRVRDERSAATLQLLASSLGAM
ncbi:LysR family transcriptional regulator [Paraburkholderia caballeronis]|uniref:DNA-binding transcriptional regulator, LysR family n=1 Tax=Paraburkholderia caballeronis TaxID=416943 RepID=A0A1H7KXQ3_9BURK|nr:LysR substrate-binding domain-containing protein [Paraburkholderia caballeronis]PXW28181.1 DNA-binding transcriptional LysR family regulator [Paraburkholderia caballeronis]PXX03547.1 DNA-binding transcriptional LysR family regulator [Paraburkholderia caballeronis]RAK04291.1 DNA-binding transcriptional LysR family regulator [Paraburkholderia caballeronis]SED86096.1 DNA-binding transcriptional regulator, LysR family [Paraburkholderia caballeronis]SEK90747.1 DNA-binding transcriptional regulat